MYFFERVRKGRRFLFVGETEWDAAKQRPRARQIELGPIDSPTGVDLSKTETVGRRRVGDVGALVWVAEQLGVARLIDSCCPSSGDGPSIGKKLALDRRIRGFLAPFAGPGVCKCLKPDLEETRTLRVVQGVPAPGLVSASRAVICEST